MDMQGVVGHAGCGHMIACTYLGPKNKAILFCTKTGNRYLSMSLGKTWSCTQKWWGASGAAISQPSIQTPVPILPWDLIIYDSPGFHPGFFNWGARCMLGHLRCALGTLHSQKTLNFNNQFPSFWWDLKDFYKCFENKGGGIFPTDPEWGGGRNPRPPRWNPARCMLQWVYYAIGPIYPKSCIFAPFIWLLACFAIK